MIVFVPIVLWVFTLLLFVLGLQLAVHANSLPSDARIAIWCAALNLGEPTINVIVVTILYFTVDRIQFVSDAAIAFVFTAPMLLVILVGLILWYGSSSVRGRTSAFAYHTARAALGFGALRYVLTTAMWLCFANASGRGTAGTVLFVLAVGLSLAGVAVLAWCWLWGRRLLDAHPTEGNRAAS